MKTMKRQGKKGNSENHEKVYEKLINCQKTIKKLPKNQFLPKECKFLSY